MNSPILRVLAPVLLLGVCALAQDVVPPPVDKIDPKDIEATLVPDKAAILPGEPVYVSLIVKNNSHRDLTLWVSDDFNWVDDRWFQVMKPRKIALTATSKDGVKLPEFDWHKSRWIGFEEGMGGYHPEKIAPSGSHAFRVFVPYWVTLNQPGSYTLTADAKLVFSIPPPPGAATDGDEAGVPTMIYKTPHGLMMDSRPAVVYADKTAVAVPVTPSATIEVTPPDKKKMDELTDALLKTVSAGETVSTETREAAGKLLAISDELAIPWLVQKLKDNSKEVKEPPQSFDSRSIAARIDALYALSKFNNDAALDALKSAAKANRGGAMASMERGIVIHYLLQSPHPGALPFLLTLHDSPDQHVRYMVVEAAGTKVPPGQAIPLLKELVHDKDPSVSEQATYFLQKLAEKNPN